MVKSKAPIPDQASMFEAQRTTTMDIDGDRSIRVEYLGERLLDEENIFKPGDEQKAKAEEAAKKAEAKARMQTPVVIPEPSYETPWKTNLLERNEHLRGILKDLGYIARTAAAWRAVDGGGSIVDQRAFNALSGHLTQDQLVSMSRGHERESEKLKTKFDNLWGLPAIEIALRTQGKDVKTHRGSSFAGKDDPKVTAPHAAYQDRGRFFDRFSNSAVIERGEYREISVAEAAKNRNKYKRQLEKQEKYLRPLQDQENARHGRAATIAANRPSRFRRSH